MKPRQAFGVVVRAFGLFAMLYGIYGGSYTANTDDPTRLISPGKGLAG
jgi:hypothetical protein